MSANIFHDYDIRGRYPGEVNESIFYNLGRATAKTFKSKKIAIGRDARLSSDTLFLYLAAGLSSQKVKVIDLGRITTPFGLWYSQTYKTDTLVITASHNPKDQNGLKIFSAKLGAVDTSSGLLKIKEKFQKLDFGSISPDKSTPVFKKEVLNQKYLNFILSQNKVSSKKLKLAIDFSNGIAGPEFVPILEKIKTDFVTLNEMPNGNFPGHSPNPLDEVSQKSIKVLLKSKKFDLGAVIDGDGDRVLFLDEQGDMVDPSYIFSLLLDFYAGPLKIKTVVKTISVGKIADATAKNQNIKLVTTKVGRSHVARAMKKEKAQLGAEKSGHYFFKDFYYGDSGLLALLFLLNILVKAKKPLSKLLEKYKKYIIMPEVNFPFEGRVDNILGQLKEKYKDAIISELDGLTAEYPTWRFNLHRSNTESLWRLSLEGEDKTQLESAQKEIEEILKK